MIVSMHEKAWHQFIIDMLKSNIKHTKNPDPSWFRDIEDLEQEIRSLDLVYFCQTGEFPA